jgi:hypothetical protein
MFQMIGGNYFDIGSQRQCKKKVGSTCHGPYCSKVQDDFATIL